MAETHWNRCADSLQSELSEQQFNTWIRPLKSQFIGDELHLLAPNRFIRNWVEEKFLSKINFVSAQHKSSAPKTIVLGLMENYNLKSASLKSDGFSVSNQNISSTAGHQVCKVSPSDNSPIVPNGHEVKAPSFLHEQDSNIDSQPSKIELGLRPEAGPQISFGSALSDAYQTEQSETLNSNFVSQGLDVDFKSSKNTVGSVPAAFKSSSGSPPNFSDSSTTTVLPNKGSALNDLFTFDSFVEGKSNQIALAATKQVASNPGSGYNPLFIYGGVGLGKTHLMHAVGNSLRARKPNARVIYLHSERFVADMVKALQLNAINDFKRYYRTVDALLIDDIQFFANKDRSQEEFFHTFNSLMEGGQQMIFTCDRYPKEIDGLEERLKSRFGWGLTVAVEPPELETRAAILMKKAQQGNIELSQESAFFIAQRVRSNVRELEGALKRVIASAHFTGRPITVDLIKESLKDLLALQQRLVTIENIQKIVAEYYKIKLNDLLSKKRTRSLARPRQLAMALAKELTNHSLPEIGDAFGGRDHTTVLHACRKIRELEASSSDIREDIKNLNRILST